MASFSEWIHLLPPRVVGYGFKARKWFWLDVDLIGNIDKNDAGRNAGFNDLVIGNEHRKLLVALVENHEVGMQDSTEVSDNLFQSLQIDLVRGKGRGLIVLLHGPPGAGKTSTAETSAAYSRRPLYAITCGDIGSTTIEVEQKLEEHTRRAEKWGCVLLLDEADVFLISRQKFRNVERNALVSIFLRQLEYYAGILFMTTNRIGQIDEAFKSRIHVALYFPPLELEQTLKIWANTMDRLKRDSINRDVRIDFNKDILLKFAKHHFEKNKPYDKNWNGRQIRNAFATAVSLAQYERKEKMRADAEATLAAENLAPPKTTKRSKDKTQPPKQTKKHKKLYLSREIFMKIADVTDEFEHYLWQLRGSDQKIAKEERLRNDRYAAAAAAGLLPGDVTSSRPQKTYAAVSREPPLTPTYGMAGATPTGTSVPGLHTPSSSSRGDAKHAWTRAQQVVSAGVNAHRRPVVLEDAQLQAGGGPAGPDYYEDEEDAPEDNEDDDEEEDSDDDETDDVDADGSDSADAQ